MSFNGGDIVEVTYNHPTVGSGSLFCKGKEDATIKRGGYESQDDDANITGDLQRIDVKNAVPWSVALPPIAWDMTSNDEQDKLIQMAESPVEADWTIAVINGTIFGGKGMPVGEIPGNTNSAQITLKLAGSGRLKKIG